MAMQVSEPQASEPQVSEPPHFTDSSVRSVLDDEDPNLFGKTCPL
jgi:hypothetical protein